MASPRGVALTNAGVLSAITANDGKVFFSINVDATEARAWEGVRAAAEEAVRAIPGVTMAMIALTAERKAGPAAAAPPPPHRHNHSHSMACSLPRRISRRKVRHRRCPNSRKSPASRP